MTSLLEISGVHAGYDKTEILHGVSLHVPAGGVAAVLGHNGAGKTTLLRAAVGLLPVKKGTITFDGEEVSSLSPHARVARGFGYVPQGQQSFAQLSTRDNLQLVADGRARGKQLIAEALDTFPALTPLLDRKAGLLSGGQRQQLAIARALITSPRLLVLDEPTEGIQPNVVAEIEGIISSLAQRGDLSVLLVEQHVGFSLRASDVYSVLDSGRITHSGVSGAAADAEVSEALAI